MFKPSEQGLIFSEQSNLGDDMPRFTLEMNLVPMYLFGKPT